MVKCQPEGRVAEDSALPRPTPSVSETLDAAITSLGDLNADELRLQWRNQLGGLAPAHLPRWLLLRLLVFCVQAAALGDLDKATLRLLRLPKDGGVGSRGARPFETRGPATREGIGLKSGALLVREWKGRLERVMILENGFAWNGKTYRSLSQIAKAMTGTNWNGHRFFGLRPAKELRASPWVRGTGSIGERDPLDEVTLEPATEGKRVRAGRGESLKRPGLKPRPGEDGFDEQQALVRSPGVANRIASGRRRRHAEPALVS